VRGVTLHGLTILFEIGAAMMAVPVARARAEHGPVAVFLVGTTIANAARLAIISYVLDPARDAMRAAGVDPAAVPFTEWVKVATIVESALFLLWPAGIAALAMAVFLRRRPWVVAAVWTSTSVVLAVGYPALRGAALAREYLAAEVASLLVGVGCFVSWLPRRREREVGLPITVTMLLIAVGLAGLVVGPWRFGIFDRWVLAQVTYAITYAVIFVLEGGFLWLKPKSLSRSSPSWR
jgi:hypothetical protein